MRVTSSSFGEGETIDPRYAEQGCDGQNVRPALSWDGAPEGTKSFAITIYDPDAPTGSGWWHWIVVDIPADVTSLDEDAELPASAREWVNDYGYEGYGGPCPPPGPAHHYVHTVHALPYEHIPVEDGKPSAQLRFTILGDELASASTTGMFASGGKG